MKITDIVPKRKRLSAIYIDGEFALKLDTEAVLASRFSVGSEISDEELSADYIIPKAFDKRVGPAVAKAVAEAARRSGVARI